MPGTQYRANFDQRPGWEIVSWIAAIAIGDERNHEPTNKDGCSIQGAALLAVS